MRIAPVPPSSAPYQVLLEYVENEITVIANLAQWAHLHIDDVSFYSFHQWRGLYLSCKNVPHAITMMGQHMKEYMKRTPLDQALDKEHIKTSKAWFYFALEKLHTITMMATSEIQENDYSSYEKLDASVKHHAAILEIFTFWAYNVYVEEVSEEMLRFYHAINNAVIMIKSALAKMKSLYTHQYNHRSQVQKAADVALLAEGSRAEEYASKLIEMMKQHGVKDDKENGLRKQ